MMHRPRIANAFVEMNQAVMENKGRITSAMKREIAYLSSMTTGCRYCEAHAIRAAERYGSSQERMLNLCGLQKTQGIFRNRSSYV